MGSTKWQVVLLSLFLSFSTSTAQEAQTPQDPQEDTAPDPNQAYPPAFLKGLQYRSVGPYRGGRVTAVTGVENSFFTFFMGSTGGGLWKTDDAGVSWKNLTDGQIGVGSIGAVAVSPSDPNVIYLGTGSSSPRGNISSGDGIYKSNDGGRNWTSIGLPKAGLISRIRVHPRDADRVYVAVMGDIFAPNPERGVYRSLDGGSTWDNVLSISDKTGCVDLSMDAVNPRILYAAMWRVERKPWTLIDGSEEGGIYKTLDGGEKWTRLEGGLPLGVLGRSGVAVSPADPQRVWVIQETPQGGGVYRSEDGGKSFKRINHDRRLLQRHWYYTRIFADPRDRDTVWVTNTSVLKSIDGGRSFQPVRVPHGDTHDLWIHPKDSNVLINSNDGGANVSLNGGKTWSTQYNQPTSEFYRLTVDNQFPYRLYGAQQDNSTISVPSLSPGGLSPQQHWYAVGGGESGHIAVDPRDPKVVYAGNYIGQITRWDAHQGHQRSVTHYPQMHDGMAGHEMRYRFQWNAPIRISPHDPDVIYHTSQYVHRSSNAGQSWTVISPDLTTNKREYQEIPGGPVQHDHTGVELYTTIFAFEESPYRKGMLWVGSDDGLVHLSTNDGKDWKDITPSGMPEEGTVNMIELSSHDPSRAFIAVYRYRRGDRRPYIFRTVDAGSSWTLLTDGKNGLPADRFVRVVREDPMTRGLLYAGTEQGVYVSFDDGRRWQEMQLNLPRTPITDIAVHRGDLVLATQGRAFWILDDLSPLRQMSDQTVQAQAHLFAPRQAYRTQLGGFRSGGAAPKNPPRGALIYYSLKEAPENAKDLKLDILDAQGHVVRSYLGKPSKKNDSDQKKRDRRPDQPLETLPIEAGLNRFNWDLTYPGPHIAKGAVMSLARTGGMKAPPGRYQVRLSWGNWSQTQDLTVLKDPRWTASDEDLRAQFDLGLKTRDLLTRSHDAIRQIRSVRGQAEKIAETASQNGYGSALEELAKKLAERLSEVEKELIQTKNESGQDPINFPPRLDNQIAYLYSEVNRQDARPTDGSYQRYDDLEKELDQRLKALDELVSEEVKRFNEALGKEKLGGLILPKDR